MIVHEPVRKVRKKGESVVTVSEPGRSLRAVTAEDREIERIKQLPPAFIPIQDAPVRDAIRLVADSAGMSYISPEEGEFEDATVSLRMNGNPWDLLQVLSESFGIGMEFRNNLWYFYTINVDELVTRSYKLRWNPQESVELEAPSINSQLGGGGVGGRSGGTTGGGGLGGGGTTGLGRQSSGQSSAGSAEIDSDRIVSEIEKVLETPTSGLDVVRVDEFEVGKDNEALGVPGWSPAVRRTGDGDAPTGTVVWDSDNRRFMVTATRQQHKRVEHLLEMIDRPQTLIKIAAIVIETDINPSMSFGMDWDFDFTTRWTSNKPNNSFDGETTLSVGGGNGLSSDFEAARLSDTDFDALLPNPSGALLTVDRVQAQLNALAQEGDSRVRQRPTVVTIDNRLVSLQAVTQTPVVDSSTVNNSSDNDTSTAQVSYISTGTVVSIFPKIIESEYADGDSVRMSIALQVSAIVDEVELSTVDGESNPFPVVAERTYTYEVVVPTGYTLAIGGLAEQRRVTNETSVPLLGSIPGLGWLFKNRTDEMEERNLIAYITPMVMESDTSEIEAGGDIPMPSFRDVERDFGEGQNRAFFDDVAPPKWSYGGPGYEQVSRIPLFKGDEDNAERENPNPVESRTTDRKFGPPTR